MAKLLDDIKEYSAWTVTAFAQLNKKLDFSLESLKEVDSFFDEQTENGQPKADSVLQGPKGSLGFKLFAIASYVGETLIRNNPGSVWKVDDNDPDGEINIAVQAKNSLVAWPAQRVMKRFKYGSEESIYMLAVVFHQQANENQ